MNRGFNGQPTHPKGCRQEAPDPGCGSNLSLLCPGAPRSLSLPSSGRSAVLALALLGIPTRQTTPTSTRSSSYLYRGIRLSFRTVSYLPDYS